MKTENELIKEYLQLKYRLNKVLLEINALGNRKGKRYYDMAKYEKYKMLLSDLESKLKEKAKELKKVL